MMKLLSCRYNMDTNRVEARFEDGTVLSLDCIAIEDEYGNTPAQHKSNLRNVYGTFAIEGMTISKDTRSNLDRIGSGQASYQQVVNELRAKYAKKG